MDYTQALLNAGLPVVSAVTNERGLVDAQFTRELTPAEWQKYLDVVDPATARKSRAESNALAIPSWAKWSEAEALDWGNTNIGQPLIDGRNNLPATLTLATARAAILQIITILDKMWQMQWALARMVIALRNQNWPNLPDE